MRRGVVCRIAVVSIITALLDTTGLSAAHGNVIVSSQSAELRVSDSGELGFSVSVSGSTMVAGGISSNAGAGGAYVFAKNAAGVWSQTAALTASDGVAGDDFGLSVSVSGTTAVIGAPYHNSQTGAAYVFTKTAGVWSQTAELTASDGGANEYFGMGVSVSGSTVVVGAEGHNSQAGAAYVFTKNATTGVWSQTAELAASDAAANEAFGHAVAVTGTTAVIGAYGHPNNTQVGAAYVFTKNAAGVWSQKAELTPSDGATGDDFGTTVAVSGTTVVVGASFHDSGVGAAYVFTKTAGIWSQTAELTASDAAADDNFGTSVSVSGTTALIGAYKPGCCPGAAYVFKKNTTTGVWSQTEELTPSDGAHGDAFGYAVSLSGTTAAIGAPTSNADKGTTYTFTI